MKKVNMEDFAKNLFMGQPKDDEKGLDKDSLLHKLQDERDRYRQAYDILMDYWDLLPEEALKDIHKELAKIGL